MDREFEPLRGDLAEIGVSLNTTARDEHVGDIEGFIRTIKEWMRATYNTLSYRNMPPRLVIEMAQHAVFWLNAFPHANGIAGNRSPRAIITGVQLDYNRHCRHQFGEYVQTHEEHDNTMAPRTVGALALYPTGNTQGSFQFFSLSTGRVLSRNHATALPMPDDIIAQVHRIARRQKAHHGMVFKDRNRIIIDDDMTDDEDEDYDPMNDDSTYDNESDQGDDAGAENGAAHIEGVDDPDDPQDPPDYVPLDHVNGPDYHGDGPANPEDVADINYDEGGEAEDNEQDEMQAGMAGVDDPDADEPELENIDGDINAAIPNNDDVNNDMEELMNNNYGRRSGRYDLRPRKAKRLLTPFCYKEQ